MGSIIFCLERKVTGESEGEYNNMLHSGYVLCVCLVPSCACVWVRARAIGCEFLSCQSDKYRNCFESA